jgi:hypothetical protein
VAWRTGGSQLGCDRLASGKFGRRLAAQRSPEEPVGPQEDSMRLLHGSKREPTSTPRRAWSLVAAPLLLVLVAISVAGCVSPADDQQGFMIEIFGFIALLFVVSIVAMRLVTRRLYSEFGITELLAATAIKNGVPGEAIIETISDTGMTMSSPDVGADAPRYQFGLKVTRADGGAPYEVEVKAFVPRLYVPMVLPGKRVGVTIDPLDPTHVSIDFSRLEGAS